MVGWTRRKMMMKLALKLVETGVQELVAELDLSSSKL